MVLRRRTRIVDERGLRRSLAIPRSIDFELGSELLFDDCSSDITKCINWSNDTMIAGNFFEARCLGKPAYVPSKNVFTFSSNSPTEFSENNEFEVIVHKAKDNKAAVVMFHHWFADERYTGLGKLLATRGITLVEATLPFHFGRSPTSHDLSEFMINPNIGLSLKSMRQGVVDGLKIVDWLFEAGYQHVFVSGICIGSWIAGLVAAKDQRIEGASLWVGGGSAADVLWTSRSSPMLKDKIKPHLTLEQLRSLWQLIDLNYYTDELSSRPLQLILANYDEIVRKEVSECFIRSLEQVSNKPHIIRLNCGHASLGLFPYNLKAALNLISFVKQNSKKQPGRLS